jgi:hypothetical protein
MQKLKRKKVSALPRNEQRSLKFNLDRAVALTQKALLILVMLLSFLKKSVRA